MHSSQWITVHNQPQCAIIFHNILTVPIAFSKNTRLLLVFHSLFDRSSFSSSRYCARLRCALCYPPTHTQQTKTATATTTTHPAAALFFFTRENISDAAIFGFRKLSLPKAPQGTGFHCYSLDDRSIDAEKRNWDQISHYWRRFGTKNCARRSRENTASPRRYR